MNPLYQMMMSGGMGSPVPPSPAPQTFQNPVQKMQFIMQAMRNPAAFVRQQFPDIPDQIANDPNQILSYLQQTRGISNQQIQQLVNTYGGR